MLICRGFLTIARARALTVAAIPSMRDEFFDRSGLLNIRLSLFSFVDRQLAFWRRAGCPTWKLAGGDLFQ